MSVTVEQVADHTFVKTKTGRGRVGGGANDVVNSETTQHVTMMHANHVTLAVIVHAVNQVAGETFDVILEQSNDRSNWFPVTQTTDPLNAPYASAHGGKEWEFANVSMAWVRVVFLIDSATSQPTGGWLGDATISCTLTTSLQ